MVNNTLHILILGNTRKLVVNNKKRTSRSDSGGKKKSAPRNPSKRREYSSQLPNPVVTASQLH